ncbi:exodeoxyribonuclease VII small subunit [filamentous cyanobacterium LEGE 07170]|nr:exodeoxyribonuclease VII small subunit [filamentous cyanobacterium LEGE 07170]
MPISKSKSNVEASTPSDSSVSTSWVYEDSVAQVEQIIERIEAGDLPLAEVFNQFTQAMQQLNQCETFLNQQQQQMDVLIETLSDEDDENF